MKINFSRIGGTDTGDNNTIHLDNSSIELDYQNELLDLAVDFHSFAGVPAKLNFFKFDVIDDTRINIICTASNSDFRLSLEFYAFDELEKFCKKLNKAMKEQKKNSLVIKPQVL